MFSPPSSPAAPNCVKLQRGSRRRRSHASTGRLRAGGGNASTQAQEARGVGGGTRREKPESSRQGGAGARPVCALRGEREKGGFGR